MAIEHEAVLNRIRRGATAMLTTKETVAVLTSLGWSLEPMPFLKSVSEGYSSKADADGVFVIRVEGSIEYQVTNRHDYLSRVVVRKLPSAAQAKNRLYVTDLTNPKRTVTKRKDLPDYVLWHFTYRGFKRVNGHRITAPNGKSFDIFGTSASLGYRGASTPQQFFKWALANTDLEQQVCDRLGLPKHSAEVRREPVGDQLLGNCPVCNADQVTHDGRMVLHGYQRPGDGYIRGECFGVNHLAYNLSSEGCEAFRVALVAEGKALIAHRRDLTAGKITRLQERRYRNEEPKVLKRGDKGFAKRLKEHIDRTTDQIEGTDREIALMQHKIDNWKPMPLRGAV
jgi:hypothetical protein